ncbi:unnamed protein product [Paramecium pentaurelia]|uniref:Uncharacterized protein n=1 Tax=Paramecium pentaurelia TaxID=43138 RepID=A0A8S1X4N0_9CILI|nr:unnamed protein product [Paramecium pentaurelia]
MLIITINNGQKPYQIYEREQFENVKLIKNKLQKEKQILLPEVLEYHDQLKQQVMQPIQLWRVNNSNLNYNYLIQKIKGFVSQIELDQQQFIFYIFPKLQQLEKFHSSPNTSEAANWL